MDLVLSLEEHVSQFHRLWAKGKKFALAGSSYGGFIALEYALAYPDNVSTMLLCSTFAWGFGGLMNAFKNVLTSERIKADCDRQLRLWTGSTHDNDDLEVATSEIRQIFRPVRLSGFNLSFGGSSTPAIPDLNYEVHNFAFSENLPRFDVRSRLCRISIPTLILVGIFDPLVSIRSAEGMAVAIPSAQLAIFSQSGHSPPMDEPETFRARVWEFLDGVK
jgi:proline iminopeptidase